jgi:diadenosine tetraphosphate (Ap4A) HIT family hydrolase
VTDDFYCDEVLMERPSNVVRETDHVLAITTLDLLAGSYRVIPKRHISSLLTLDE